ncbi:hypothetical protein ACFZAV_21630 [Streptomyces sp. NPDC008343]|uniref:hypothetical protein n=1 Tax=Streptomyces sp. NPDC008343 TaxID=3364828 RepID=UPI0036E0F62C
MEEAALVRAWVVDLVNVALEEVLRAGVELLGDSTLDRVAGAVRTRVEGEIRAVSPDGRARLSRVWRGCWWCRTVSAAVRSP